MERFPLSLISDPTAIVNEDRRDVYNNILLFTIMGDNYQRTPSEMHIFQCKSISVSLVTKTSYFLVGLTVSSHDLSLSSSVLCVVRSEPVLNLFSSPCGEMRTCSESLQLSIW